MQRHIDPKHFVKPDEFIPERWTDRPELVLDRRAWHPFIIGKFSHNIKISRCEEGAVGLLDIKVHLFVQTLR